MGSSRVLASPIPYLSHRALQFRGPSWVAWPCFLDRNFESSIPSLSHRALQLGFPDESTTSVRGDFGTTFFNKFSANQSAGIFGVIFRNHALRLCLSTLSLGIASTPLFLQSLLSNQLLLQSLSETTGNADIGGNSSTKSFQQGVCRSVCRCRRVLFSGTSPLDFVFRLCPRALLLQLLLSNHLLLCHLGQIF